MVINSKIYNIKKNKLAKQNFGGGAFELDLEIFSIFIKILLTYTQPGLNDEKIPN